MKVKFLVLAILFLSTLNTVKAQDKLLDRKGNEYLVKVLEITPDSILYKPFPDSAQAITYIIAKAEVFMLTYQNGAKEIFQEESQPKKVKLTDSELYLLGRKDAKNYHKTSGAYFGTLGATLFYPLGGPLLGIGTGTVISISKAPYHKIRASKPELKQDKNYLEGYQDQAKSKKLGSAAGGFATGLGIYAVILIVALSQIY